MFGSGWAGTLGVVPATRDPLTLSDDPAVAAEHLLGPGAAEVLAALLAPLGATVERYEPTQQAYQPGRSLRVVHRVAVRWADGSRTTEELGLSCGVAAPEGALVLADGDREIVAWRVPHDPWLPGLAPVLDPEAVGQLLAGLGYPVRGTLRCRVRAYRAGRRAVVEVTGDGVRAFVKVVRPHRAEELHAAHVELAQHLPIPRALGWSPEHGVVVLEALPGRTLRDALEVGTGLPRAGAVLEVLDRLPPTDRLRPLDWRAAEFAELVGGVVPHLVPRLDALVAGLAPFEERAAAEPLVPVHGDLYEAQLMVDGGAVTGVLDVDTFALGRRVDDLATLIGHLSVLAIGSLPPQRQRVERYAARLLDSFDRVVDPVLLRAATAGVVLGLATGSFRVLDPDWEVHTELRVALAEAWLESARLVDEEHLTSTQRGAQLRSR